MNNLTTIRDGDRVVFYGDSITVQNQYPAMIETHLITRFSDRRITFYNLAWEGDVTEVAADRFERDVAPYRPTVVLTNFGMNDGGYGPPSVAIVDRFVSAQRRLSRLIEESGARQIVLTGSPADPDGEDAYNATLALLRDALMRETSGPPVIDVFGPVLAAARRSRAAGADYCALPDFAHPTPAGHLMIAYAVLCQLTPGGAQYVNCGRNRGAIETSHGVQAKMVSSSAGHCELELRLPHLPTYIPPAARTALAVVPHQAELNGLWLRVPDWGNDSEVLLSIDGRETAIINASDLRNGVDLALHDSTPWAVAGRRLWELSQHRWQKHYEAWREMGFEQRPEMLAVPGRADMIESQKGYVEGLCVAQRLLVQPHPHRIMLTAAERFRPFERVEVSPLYPANAMTDLCKAFPPETSPQQVTWQLASPVEGVLDLAAYFGHEPANVIVYVRAILETYRSCEIVLEMGSDDGLAIVFNGHTVHTHAVKRACRIGDDTLRLSLQIGRNVLLFKVGNVEGGYALGVRCRLPDDVRVDQVW